MRGSVDINSTGLPYPIEMYPSEYLGFASYDVDKNPILAYHIMKFTGSTDTYVNQDLKPGDTKLYVDDASGWYNTRIHNDEVVGYCLKYAMKRGDTLVIVLADHETGGLAVGLKHGHSIDINQILKIKRSVYYMAKEIKKGGDIAEVVEKYTGIKLTDEEIRYIEEMAKKDPKYGLGNALGEVISRKVGVGFASHKHTGEPIPIMVYGPGAEMFRGFLHHVDTSRLIAKDMMFGTYTPTNLKVMPSNIKGDINGNYIIDLDDAYIALTFVGSVADKFTAILDMDNNGLIDYKDVVIIYNQAIK